MTETDQIFALQGVDIEIHGGAGASLNDFTAFGIKTHADLQALIERALQEEWRTSPAVLTGMNRQYELAPSEPVAEYVAFGVSRAGLGTAIATSDGIAKIIAAWPFCTDGVQHTMEVERLMLAPNRVSAIVVGTIADTLPICFLDTEFVASRVFYLPGSIHDYVLTGIITDFRLASHEPIRLESGRKGTESLRKAMGDAAPEQGKPVKVRTEGLAAILPLGEPPDCGYQVIGPVTQVERYPLTILYEGCWKLRVTVCRIDVDDVREFSSTGRKFEEDEHGWFPINLDLILTDHILGDRKVPEVGDDINVIIQLQGRIWISNVKLR